MQLLRGALHARREVSRPFDDVLMEVADLADQGVKEVTLLGQNVNAYRGAMGDSGEIADFAMLLEYVHEIPGIERIRYTTSHPKEMTQRMMDAYARLPKLVSFLHLPVQAGSDRVLAAMKRGYTTLEFKSVVRRLRAARPNLTLSSDFIVGFPGETEEDFEKTMKLIEDVGFDTSFSFVYSRRPGTPAADLSDDTPQDVKLLPAAAPAGADQRAGRRHRPRHDRHAPAPAGGRPVAARSQRAHGPHREQPHRQLRRTRAAHRPDGRRHHHRRAHNSLRAGSPTWTATPKGPNDPSPLTRPAQHAHRRQPGRRQHPPGQSLRPLDENLRQLADGMSVKLSRRGSRVTIEGETTELAGRVLRRFHEQAVHRALTVDDIQLGLVEIGVGRQDETARGTGAGRHRAAVAGRRGDGIALRTRRSDLRPRTARQRDYLNNILKHDITFGVGPAGTGKTWLAVACAIDAMERDTVQRLVLTRPAVEAGERLGFLPGDLAQKVDPYLRPLYDALYDLMGFDKVQRLFEKQTIEIAPLAYMRGRTLNHAFIILDEAQNTTPEQMKMFLTRIGFGSKAVITGDPSQVDLPRGQDSGLAHAVKVLHDVQGIATTRFTSRDVVRHPLVARIVDAYDRAAEHDA